MKENLKKLVNQFKITLFYIAPLHLISNITFKVSRIEDKVIKNFLIKLYISIFKIDLDEYKNKNIEEYISLNDFFTRELDMSFRKKIDNQKNIISPCDGTIAGYGEINYDTPHGKGTMCYKKEGTHLEGEWFDGNFKGK